MKEHTNKDEEVDHIFCEQTKNECNARSRAWGRILMIGEARGDKHTDRINEALTTDSWKPPPL